MQVTAYYVRCAKTNNHTVREAACQCIAELFMKIEQSAVKPQLAKLQSTLRRCLKDDSWTVSLIQGLPKLSPLGETKSSRLYFLMSGHQICIERKHVQFVRQSLIDFKWGSSRPGQLQAP